jgi:hypothetical protein
MSDQAELNMIGQNMNYVFPFSQGLMEAMKFVKNARFFCAVISVGMFLSTEAQAEVLTEVCVRTANVSEAGTDTEGVLEATLVGISGLTSQKINLDNADRDDLNRNTWSCFTYGDGNNRPIGQRISDVGPAVLMTITAAGVEDDWCLIQAYTRRYQGVASEATILSESQFMRPDLGDGRTCFGNERNSVTEQTFQVKNRPSGDKIKVKGFWESKGSHIGNGFDFQHTASVTSGKSRTNTSAWSVAVAVGTEIESELTGIKGSLSVTSTTSEEKSVTSFTETTLTDTVTKACSAQGLGGGNAQMVYWVWNSQVQQPFGGSTNLVTRESVCMIDAPAGSTPKCRPGCFDTSDVTLQTCQKSAVCKAMLK